MNNQSVKIFILTFIVIFTSGCAGLMTGSVYQDPSKGEQEIIYNNEDALVRVAFNGDPYFLSLGVVAPVIPVYVNPIRKDKLELGLDLNMYHAQYFSILAKPCLMVDDNKELCPESVRIYAVGLRDIGSMEPGGHNYVKMREFTDTDDITIDLKNASDGLKLDKNYVLQYYDCEEDSLDFLRVYYTFIYQCRDKCPQRIVMNPHKMISVNGLSLDDKDITFERKVITDGGFLWQ